jgi:hypothetical protein
VPIAKTINQGANLKIYIATRLHSWPRNVILQPGPPSPYVRGGEEYVEEARDHPTSLLL